ncbi:MAG: MFS transporter [Steroidobacteraceae bacterium]
MNSSSESGLTGPVWSAVYVGVAAATLPAVLPVMVGVMADDLGFGTIRAGYVASANMAGIGVGSILCLALTRRWSWTALIIVGAIVMIGTNLLTMQHADYSYFMLMRLLSGLGEGVIAGICYAAMGQSQVPARASAFYAAGQGLVGAVGMGIMPSIVAAAGWPWLFVFVSILALPAFFLAKSIGTIQPRPAQKRGGKRRVMSWKAAYALISILIYFVGMSAIWAFLERIGHAKGLDTVHLSIALSASAVGNMVGSLAVGVVAHRLSTVAGLVTGFLVLIAGLLGLVALDEWQAFLVSAVLFFFSWGFYFPFQFRLLARVDDERSVSGIMPAITSSGLTIGPAVGGILLVAGGAGSVCAFGLAAVVASLVSTLHINARSKRAEE